NIDLTTSCVQLHSSILGSGEAGAFLQWSTGKRRDTPRPGDEPRTLLLQGNTATNCTTTQPSDDYRISHLKVSCCTLNPG
ncbi:hypothetical protein CHARACLAT_004903, partial [Characodon lateralis]|nr:hypothetical protein [Characodon lateralis]